MIISQSAQINSIDACPRCGSHKVRRYSSINFRERLRSLLGIYPYQCTHYTCQHRFYRRSHGSFAENENYSISSVSDNLYGHLRSEIKDHQSRVNPQVLSNLYDRKQQHQTFTDSNNTLGPEVITNLPRDDFQSESSMICRKYLTLTWQEQGIQQSHTINSKNQHGNPNRVKLGRDPSRCDLVFVDRTISGLNAEIYFDDDSGNFHLHNLRPINPPFINERKVISSASLESGILLYLGKVAISVEIEFNYYEIEPTILFNRDRD